MPVCQLHHVQLVCYRVTFANIEPPNATNLGRHKLIPVWCSCHGFLESSPSCLGGNAFKTLATCQVYVKFKRPVGKDFSIGLKRHLFECIKRYAEDSTYHLSNAWSVVSIMYCFQKNQFSLPWSMCIILHLHVQNPWFTGLFRKERGNSLGHGRSPRQLRWWRPLCLVPQFVALNRLSLVAIHIALVDGHYKLLCLIIDLESMR